MFDTHIFLGPSLDVKVAKTILINAHYHPPVKCGDIIKILRLNPKKIIIIDGLYENVPAVWHKEILLAIELGVEVWGASSMGALRAAELHQYGMHGYGKIYHDFKSGKLNDDDELAVLHHCEEGSYKSTNDAMVNIRATCKKAYNEKVISMHEKDKLIHYCKAQFYPYRSLMQAAKKYNLEGFIRWLDLKGLYDLKQEDAIGALKHIQNMTNNENLNVQTPRSYFLKEIILYANLNPFNHHSDSLPSIEKDLYALYTNSPVSYMLVAELAFFTRILFRFTAKFNSKLTHEKIAKCIQENNLYSPDIDFKFYKTHSNLHSIYDLICIVICDNNITEDLINNLLPAVRHYYDIEDNDIQSENTLRALLVLILAVNFYQNTLQKKPQKHVITKYIADLQGLRKYSKNKLTSWLNPTHFNSQYFKYFLGIYLNVAAYPQKVADKIDVGQDYFQWIYDAYNLNSEHV